MTIIQKKAFVDQIMLGFFLFATVFVFVATITDENKARSEIVNIKKILQSASLASAKYYTNENNNEIEAENIAKGIISKTSLGAKIKDDIVFTWNFDHDPNYVKVKLDNYKLDFFWYRLLGLDATTVKDLESKANINSSSIAINGCNKTFNIGQTYDYMYQETNIFNKNHMFSFYNRFAINAMNDFNNDVSSFLNLDNFIGEDINIDVLDCDGSVKDIIPVHINNGYCAKGCCSISFFGVFSFGGCSFISNWMCNMFKIFENFTENMFNDIVWANATSTSCEDQNLFRINFTVLNNRKITLEY